MQTPNLWKPAMKQSPMAAENSQVRGRSSGDEHPSVPKKTASRSPTRGCLCSPTTHPGSFRCRYHRTLHIVKWRPVETKIVSSPSPPPPAAERKRRTVGSSRLSRVTFAPGVSDHEEVEEQSGPLRFLKQVAGAGDSRLEDKALEDGSVSAGPGAARAATSCRNGQLYEVKKGDTLSAIARERGSSITILSTVNNMSSDVIYPGQKLWIPVTYEIEKGDTLFQISRRFKTTIGDIMKMNSIKDPNSIQAGDILLLPARDR